MENTEDTFVDDMDELWADDADDITLYDEQAQQQAVADMAAAAETEASLTEDIQEVLPRRSLRFNNPDLPSRSHDSEALDSKWDKYKI